jgi:hypothetical protein
MAQDREGNILWPVGAVRLLRERASVRMDNLVAGGWHIPASREKVHNMAKQAYKHGITPYVFGTSLWGG